MKLSTFKPYLPFIKGSIGQTSYKCGKQNCVCTQNKPHTAFNLSYRQRGKTVTIHIPKPMVPQVTKLCHNWRAFNGAIEEESHLMIREILKTYKENKERPKKKG